MNRFLGVALVGLSVLVSASAFADKPSYPMKADAFQQLVDARLARHRAKMEEHIKAKNIAADKAKEKRDRFDAHAAKIQAAAKQAEADGVVTEDEAKGIFGEHHRKAK
jgi:predicted anti-sigma-YlaC factor YlaD